MGDRVSEKNQGTVNTEHAVAVMASVVAQPSLPPLSGTFLCERVSAMTSSPSLV